MITSRKFAASAALAFGLLLSAGSAFAAPVFTSTPPNSGMPLDDFKAQMEAFNPSEVTNLVNAKVVAVIKFADAWDTRINASVKSENMLSDFSDQIALRRDALKKNPEAMKLLEEHHINVDDVIEIITDGDGGVALYVS